MTVFGGKRPLRKTFSIRTPSVLTYVIIRICQNNSLLFKTNCHFPLINCTPINAKKMDGWTYNDSPPL